MKVAVSVARLTPPPSRPPQPPPEPLYALLCCRGRRGRACPFRRFSPGYNHYRRHADLGQPPAPLGDRVGLPRGSLPQLSHLQREAFVRMWSRVTRFSERSSRGVLACAAAELWLVAAWRPGAAPPILGGGRQGIALKFR